MKKSILLLTLSLALVLVISGCVHQASNQVEPPEPDNTVPPTDEVTTPDNEVTTPDDEEINAADEPVGTVDRDPVTLEFSITARQWLFDPAQISVKKGDSVKLTITSTDVKHGFSIPEFNVNAELNPGEITVVEFVADKTGTFTFSCSVVCGAGHTGMKGTIIVVE